MSANRPPEASPDLPWGFAETYHKVRDILAEDSIDPELFDRALEAGASLSCDFLRELMAGEPFAEALRTVEGIDPQAAADILRELREGGMEDFLREERRLFVAARIPASEVEELIDECRSALRRADPALIIGSRAVEAFARLRDAACDVEAREQRRVREHAQHREAADRDSQQARSRAASVRWKRWLGKSVGGVVVAAADLSILAASLGLPTFVPVASALAGSAIVALADVIIHE